MDKVVVKTTGDFQLQDPQTSQIVPQDGESEEILRTAFIDERIRLGQLEVVKEIQQDEASTTPTLPSSKFGDWADGSGPLPREEQAVLDASDRDMAKEIEASTMKDQEIDTRNLSGATTDAPKVPGQDDGSEQKQAEGSGGAKKSEGGRTGGRTKSDDA